MPNTTLDLQLARILDVQVEALFQLDAEPSSPPVRVTVDLIRGAQAARKSQPVQLCPVGKRMVGVSAVPQPVMLPMADGVVIDSSKRTRQAKVQLFSE